MIAQVPSSNSGFAVGVVIILSSGIVLAIGLMLSVKDFIEWRKGHAQAFLFYGITRLAVILLVFPVVHVLLQDTPFGGRGYRFIQLNPDTWEYTVGIVLLAVGYTGIVVNYGRISEVMKEMVERRRQANEEGRKSNTKLG